MEQLEPVELFLQAGNRKFSFLMLINAHSRLSVLQMSKGSVSFEDIIQCLNLSAGPEVTNVDLNAHAALIYEGALVPVLTTKGPLLRLNKELIANDANYLKAIITVMYAHSNGIEHPVIEEFKLEASKFLKKSNSTVLSASPEVQSNQTTSFAQQPLPETVETRSSSVSSIDALNLQAKPANVDIMDLKPPGLNTQGLIPGRLSGAVAPPGAPVAQSPAAAGFIPGNLNQQNFANMNFAPQQPLRRYPEPVEEPRGPISDIEKTEPIVRLLAHIRKEGMDILFPQIVQDKVLMAVYAAMKCGAPLAHRELIDMVIAVKEGSAISQLEQISRTKVRGVLALLKHAQLFVTHGVEGDAVRLHLASNVTSFKDLRDRHDTFLNRYILIHHLFIPVNIKSEIVWQLDPEVKVRRLEELKSLESALVEFFKVVFPNGPRKAPPPAQVPAPGSASSMDYTAYSGSSYGSVPSALSSGGGGGGGGFDSPYGDYGQSPYGRPKQSGAAAANMQLNMFQQQQQQQQGGGGMSYGNMGNKMGGMNMRDPRLSAGMSPTAGGGGGGYHQSLSVGRYPQQQQQMQQQQGQYGNYPPKINNPTGGGGGGGGVIYARNLMQQESDYQGNFSPSVNWSSQSLTPKTLPPQQQQQPQQSYGQQQFDGFNAGGSGASNTYSFLSGGGGGNVGLGDDSDLRFKGNHFAPEPYSAPHSMNKSSPVLAPLSSSLGQMSMNDNFSLGSNRTENGPAGQEWGHLFYGNNNNNSNNTGEAPAPSSANKSGDDDYAKARSVHLNNTATLDDLISAEDDMAGHQQPSQGGEGKEEKLQLEEHHQGEESEQQHSPSYYNQF